VFLEATNQLRESPEFELYELTAKNAEMFEEVVSKQTALLEKQIIDLTNEADQLSKEIGKLTTQGERAKRSLPKLSQVFSGYAGRDMGLGGAGWCVSL